jgi:pre-mRNA-processing factor 17
MDLFAEYGSEDDDEDKDSVVETNVAATKPTEAIEETPMDVMDPPEAVAKRFDRRILNSAPAVSLTAGRFGSNTSTSLTTVPNSVNDSVSHRGKRNQQGDLVLMNNPTKLVMYQPVQGPQVMDPQSASGSSKLQPAGQAEANIAFDETTFREQRAAFERTGRALAPDSDGQQILRTTLGYSSGRLELFAKKEEDRRKRPRPDPNQKTQESSLVNGSDDEAEHGVWAPPSKEEQWVLDNSLTDIAVGGMDALAPEQLAEREYLTERARQKGIQQETKEEESSFDRLVERKMAHLLPPKMANANDPDNKVIEPTTTFHGKEEFDYKGNSWMAPPAGTGAVLADGALDMNHHRCFVPKKCVHRFTGHNKGVHRIRLFPRTGHLLLSAGLDGKCKVWSVVDKCVMRTYVGHTAGVRDVQFNHDGSKFLSASFDRTLRLWNTETGAVVNTFSNKKVPYVVQFYPKDDNLFVVGCSDNKIVCYDATTAEITQEYNHHLAPVNAILFVEDHGTKMVSSGDDKKVLVWEWDIGVPIKYISDPTMHSMPSLTMHPSQQYFCAQSLDNTIAVFQASNRFALQRKKTYSGHVVSGYACEMAFSPDGQYLVSGDGNGNLFFWDWKKHKILQKFRAHTGGPAICCAWHPLEPSVMFSCGWDGIIKMWS